MGNIFAASEVVSLGIEIEKNGRAFYLALAEQSANQKTKDVFMHLAAEEEKHIIVFEKILSQAEQYEPTGVADDYWAYMRALAGECVFTQHQKGTQIAQAIKSDGQAVDMGIGFEKDSIVFYEGIKKAVPPVDMRIIDDVIVQEQRHLAALIDLKNA